MLGAGESESHSISSTTRITSRFSRRKNIPHALYTLLIKLRVKKSLTVNTVRSIHEHRVGCATTTIPETYIQHGKHSSLLRKGLPQQPKKIRERRLLCASSSSLPSSHLPEPIATTNVSSSLDLERTDWIRQRLRPVLRKHFFHDQSRGRPGHREPAKTEGW